MPLVDPWFTDPRFPQPTETTEPTYSNLQPGDYLPGWTPWGYFPDPEVLNETSQPTGQEKTISVAAPGEPLAYVFGRTLVKPKIIAVEAVGDQLYVDYVVGAGVINAYEFILQGGEDVGLPDGWEYYYGTSATDSPAQVASPLMIAAKGAYDTLSDVAHIVAVMDAGDSLDIRVMVQGLKLFDPRPSPQTTSYSRNPALALARIFADSGYQVDYDTVGTLATYCDETVGTGVRWTIDLAIERRSRLKAWAHTLAQYCGSCHIDVQGGSVKFGVDEVVTTSPVANHTITADDIQRPTTSKIGVRQVPERVIIHYREQDGASRTATLGSGSTGQTSRLQMPGFSEYTMAQRFAIQTRNKAQADLRHTHTAFDAALEPTLGDIASVTYAPHGISNKLMRLVDYREISRGRWSRTYAEYDASLYNDSVFIEPDPGDTELPDPAVIPKGPTPSIIEELFTDETATTYSRLKITWTGTSWPYVSAYQVVCDGEQKILNTLVAHEGTGTHTVYTSAVKQDVTYSVYTRIQSQLSGALGDPSDLATIVALGKLLAPGDVPWMNASEVGGLIWAEWGAAEEIDGDLRGYTLKLLADAHYTDTSADWTNTNTILVADRLDAQYLLRPGPETGTYWLGIVAVDTTGTESEVPLWRQIIITTDAWTTGNETINSQAGLSTLVNMHEYVIDGEALWVVTSDGASWASRFGDTSPQATWGDTITQSPAERWGGDLATDSSFTSEAWDWGSVRDGLWSFSTETVTLFGGTQANAVLLSGDTSPISYTENAGISAQDTARYMKVKIETTDSPASAGDGLHIKMPIQVSSSSEQVPQTGSVTIADTSPLDNPKSIVFTSAFSDAPKVIATASGSSALIAVVDNVTASGFDLYLFDAAGAKTSGTVYWDAKGN